MKKDSRMNILVTKEFRQEVKIKATNEGKTITQVVTELLKKWLKK